jgi:beta-lactamase class A
MGALGDAMTSLSKRIGTGLALAAVASVGAYATSQPPGVPTRAQSTAPMVTPEPVPTPIYIANRMNELGRGFDGQVGIAVNAIDDNWLASWKAGDLYPQQSVSKLWVAITAMDAVDKGKLSLDDPVTLTRDDLTLFHQPIAEEVLKTGSFTTTVGDLLVRQVTQSDNTANDKLMRLAGGPGAVRAMIRAKHLGAIRFDDGERALQSKIAGLKWDPSYSIGNAFFAARDALPPLVRKTAFDRYVADPYDGAEPVAIVTALARLKGGELLSPASTQHLLDIMSHTVTGANRLKGGLAPGWVLNHKTGTGQVLGPQQAGYNDIGILTAPDGRSYAVAVMIKLTSVPLPVRMAMMNDVVRAVIAQHDMQYAPVAQPEAAQPSR